MKKQELEKLMQDWVDREEKSTPELRPTREMYRRIQAGKRTGPVLLYQNYYTIGAVAAGLVLLVALYFLFVQPIYMNRLSTGVELAFLGQRNGFAAEPGVVVRHAGKTGKGVDQKSRLIETGPFGKLDIQNSGIQFQFQRAGSRFVEGIDLLQAAVTPLNLTVSDNYRLLLELQTDCYLYIYQSSVTGGIVQLFPNATLSGCENPVPRERQILLPEEPDWFYLHQEPGEHLLYILITATPLNEVEDNYRLYQKAGEASEREEISAVILNLINGMVKEPLQETSGTLFRFNHSETSLQ